jgi:hypothetical protein
MVCFSHSRTGTDMTPHIKRTDEPDCITIEIWETEEQATTHPHVRYKIVCWLYDVAKDGSLVAPAPIVHLLHLREPVRNSDTLRQHAAILQLLADEADKAKETMTERYVKWAAKPQRQRKVGR